MASSLGSTRKAHVCVAGLGASTALGRDAWSSAAAVRASISAFGEHPYMVDRAGKPMRVAMASWLDAECDGLRRFESLLVPAIEQALAQFPRLAGRRVALVLALPAPRPGLPAGLEVTLRSSVAERFGNRFSAIATFQNGHAGALLGMRAAAVKIQEGAFDACVVAGVESYLEPETLEWLDASEQMHGAGALNNPWGFVPGEAAGAVLLVSGDTVQTSDKQALAYVLGVGLGFEQHRIRTETVCVGEGLTTAFREALAALPPGAKVTDIYCDMNGELYRAEEFGFAGLRTRESFESPSDFVAAADCWGDVSAASPLLAMVLATAAAQKSYAHGAFSFLWASSDSGERGAALLVHPFYRRT